MRRRTRMDGDVRNRRRQDAMNETTRVFALVGDAGLRRALQQQWRG
jgi:hypothetical protein